MIPTTPNLPLKTRQTFRLDQFNLNLARILAEYASRAYDPLPFTRAKAGIAWCLFLDSDVTDARVLMEDTGNEIILSFRGTHNIADWFQDGKIEMVPFPNHDRCVLVHRGFLEDALSLWPKITERLERNRQKPIFVTGHSKGADDAILTAKMLFDHGFNVHNVYSIASARPGNRHFRRVYNKALGKVTFRVACEGDLVPHLAAAWNSWRHVGNEVFFRPEGKFKVRPTRWFEFLADEKRAMELADWSLIGKYHSIDQDYIPLIDAALKLLKPIIPIQSTPDSP